MAALLQTFRTDIQATLAATVQQEAQIANLRQEFEAQMHLSANIMNQLTNKLTQLDTQARDNGIEDGWQNKRDRRGTQGVATYLRSSHDLLH